MSMNLENQPKQQPENSPRYELHRLIGMREKANKRMSMGNPNAQVDFDEAEKALKELLQKNPELESEVEKVEDHFEKRLYS